MIFCRHCERDRRDVASAFFQPETCCEVSLPDEEPQIASPGWLASVTAMILSARSGGSRAV